MKNATADTLAKRLVKLIHNDELYASLQPYAGLLLADANVVTIGKQAMLTLTFYDGMGSGEQTVKRFTLTEE